MHVHCPRLKNSLVRVPCLRHNCFTPIMMVCDEINAINSTHTLHLSVQQYFAYSFKMVDFFVSQVPPITNMPHVSKVPCFAIHFKGVYISQSQIGYNYASHFKSSIHFAINFNIFTVFNTPPHASDVAIRSA